MTRNGVYRYRTDEGWQRVDESRGTTMVVARSGVVLLATKDALRFSADGGTSFASLYGVEHERISCDGHVFIRDVANGGWRLLARRLSGTVRSLAPDPFNAEAVFAGTSEGTFHVAPDTIVKVAGPSSGLRLIDRPTYSAVAGVMNGHVTELAIMGCTVSISNYSAVAPPSPDYLTWFYPSWYRLFIRTSTPLCSWKFDLATLPQWAHFYLVSGQFAKGTNIVITGPATIDIKTDRNTGYGRNATYVINGPSNQLRSEINQWNRLGLCMHKPVSKDQTLSTFYDENEFLVLTRRWGDPTVVAPRVIFQLADSSGCPADGLLRAATPGFAGSQIFTQGVYQKGQPIVVSTPFVPQNLVGEAAVFDLRGNGSVAPSMVATLLLPPLSALPADLQIKSQTMNQTVLAFGATGGEITIPSSVTRSQTDPKRRCAFASSLYRAVGGSWLSVSSKSGCPGASPDSGNIVVTATANHNTTTKRVGVVYAPWGWAAVIVQPSD